MNCSYTETLSSWGCYFRNIEPNIGFLNIDIGNIEYDYLIYLVSNKWLSQIHNKVRLHSHLPDILIFERL